MQDDPISDECVRDAGPGTDVAAPPNRHPIADHSARGDRRPAPDLRLAPDDGPGLDPDRLFQHGRGVHGRLVGAGQGSLREERIRIEKRQRERKRAVGRLHDQRDGSRRHAIGEGPRDQARRRPRGLELAEILSIVEKRDLA